MKWFLEKLQEVEQRRLTRVLQLSIVTFLLLLFIGVLVFYAHYLRDGSKPWTSQDGELIFTVFSAIFAGFNVLAFIALTLAIERQNSKREAELAKYDALRIKLQRQREIGKAFNAMIPRYISPAYFENMLTTSDVLQAEAQLKQDAFTCLSIQGLGSSRRIFNQVTIADIQEFGVFAKDLEVILEKYVKTTDMKQFHKEIVDYYTEYGRFIPDVLIAINEGVELDIQLTLFESLGTPISEISMTTLPEKSQRYINDQRRKNK